MSEPSEILLQNLSAIQQIVTAVCRGKGMDAQEIEEFAAVVRLRLVENDYAIVRAFRGRSSFRTYMTSVVARLLIDYRRQEWGKWRDSAAAERLGAAGVDLERLLQRDGRAAEEAVAIVMARHPALTRAELLELAAKIAPRTRRKMVPLEDASHVSIEDSSARAQQAQTAARISHVVRAYIAGLAPDDQLVLKLRFDSDMSVTQIAQSLKRDYQRLWRHLQKLYGDLRQHLQREGIGRVDVENLVGSDVLLDFQLKNCDRRPSEEEESSVAARQEDMSS